VTDLPDSRYDDPHRTPSTAHRRIEPDGRARNGASAPIGHRIVGVPSAGSACVLDLPDVLSVRRPMSDLGTADQRALGPRGGAEQDIADQADLYWVEAVPRFAPSPPPSTHGDCCVTDP
jgi:hypothetical protein